MKKGIHPENYRPVVFKDMSNGDVFLSRSTVNTKETIEFEGETYPLVKLEISSTSHPFYTGKSNEAFSLYGLILCFFASSITTITSATPIRRPGTIGSFPSAPPCIYEYEYPAVSSESGIHLWNG